MTDERCEQQHDEAPSTQLDLFRDSRSTRIEHDVVAALCEWRFQAAKTALSQLGAVAPDHPRLGAFQTLVCDGAALWDQTDAPAEALARMQNRVVPAAAALERLAPGYLEALWGRLATTLARQAFAPERPQQHASYAAARTGDWVSVRDAVEREFDWWRQPVLLARRLEAAGRLGEDDTGLDVLCRLCWDFSETAAESVGTDPRFASPYRDFLDGEDDLPITDFPAWYALARNCPLPLPNGVRNQKALEVADAVNAVLAEAPDSPDVAARRRLRSCHGALFQLYMDRRRALAG